jgi:phage terminase large subunit-like protein
MQKALQYIDDVKSGHVKTGRYIKLLIDRHLSDLKKSKEKAFPYYFDYDEAAHAINAFSLFRLPTSNGGNAPFILMPYQECILFMAYGWRKKKNSRKRFRRVYLKVARGNAKTEFLVGVGTYEFAFSDVDNPEVFWIATKKDQAKIGWKRQVTMLKKLVEDEPALESVFGFHATEIFKRGELSWVKYLGKDSKSEDGWKPSCALADEYHAHVDDGMVNVMESGFVKRDDPMLWIITTAGYNPTGPNSEFLANCKKMLEGALPGENVLPFIYELDPEDNWEDPENWQKANPGIGHVLTIDGLAEEYKKIQIGGKSKEIDFKVKNLNIEQNSKESWIRHEDWVRCGGVIDDAALIGRECYAGIDLSLTQDITALALFFPKKTGEEQHILKVFYWIPEENPDIMSKNEVPYDRWINDGRIFTTPGRVINLEETATDMGRIMSQYKVKRADIDPWCSAYVETVFKGLGIRVNKFAQQITYLSNPTQALERLILGAEINHGNDPVLTWMVSNCETYRNSNDNIRIIKSQHKNKIDGIAASINAVFGWDQELHAPKGVPYIFLPGAKLVTT